MNPRVNAIHHFWFEGIDDRTKINNGRDPFRKWFTKDEKFDTRIRGGFEKDLLAASSGAHDDWAGTMKGRLALILLFDQFTRNIYRNSPQMFAFDERALALALEAIQDKADMELMLIERVFLYLPLEHSEDIRMQELSLERFRSLIDDVQAINPGNAAYYKYTFDYAQRHYDIIKRFGRFPHRNAILGRSSTKEEEAFLKKPGSGF